MAFLFVGFQRFSRVRCSGVASHRLVFKAHSSLRPGSLTPCISILRQQVDRVMFGMFGSVWIRAVPGLAVETPPNFPQRGFLIFCNALVFAVEAQYRGFEFADAANFRGAPNGQQNLGRRQIFRLLRLRGSASGLLD